MLSCTGSLQRPHRPTQPAVRASTGCRATAIVAQHRGRSGAATGLPRLTGLGRAGRTWDRPSCGDRCGSANHLQRMMHQNHCRQPNMHLVQPAPGIMVLASTKPATMQALSGDRGLLAYGVSVYCKENHGQQLRFCLPALLLAAATAAKQPAAARPRRYQFVMMRKCTTYKSMAHLLFFLPLLPPPNSQPPPACCAPPPLLPLLPVSQLGWLFVRSSSATASRPSAYRCSR